MLGHDIPDIIQRLCRIESDNLIVSKEHTEAACKWMQERIWHLEREVARISSERRASDIAHAHARPARPRLGEIRK